MSQLRLAARALLLAIIATCRGVYVTIEQPSGSRMQFFPDLVRTGKLIAKHFGHDFWKEQFLPGAKFCTLTMSCISQSHQESLAYSLVPQKRDWEMHKPSIASSHQITYVCWWLVVCLLSWMGCYGSPTAKPSKLWGTPPWPQGRAFNSSTWFDLFCA